MELSNIEDGSTSDRHASGPHRHAKELFLLYLTCMTYLACTNLAAPHSTSVLVSIDQFALEEGERTGIVLLRQGRDILGLMIVEEGEDHTRGEVDGICDGNTSCIQTPFPDLADLQYTGIPRFAPATQLARI